MTDRLNRGLLRDYILGSTYVGPGLLRRVEQRVLEQDVIDSPIYKTGSVMVTGAAAGRDAGNEDGLSEETFGLLVGLVQWLGKGIGWDHSGDTAKGLLKQLVSHRITDVTLLTRGIASEDVPATFSVVRARVEALLPSADGELSEDDVLVMAKIDALIKFLQDFMEAGCNHEWEQVSSSDIRVVVQRCRCGVQRYLDPEVAV